MYSRFSTPHLDNEHIVLQCLWTGVLCATHGWAIGYSYSDYKLTMGWSLIVSRPQVSDDDYLWTCQQLNNHRPVSGPRSINTLFSSRSGSAHNTGIITQTFAALCPDPALSEIIQMREYNGADGKKLSRHMCVAKHWTLFWFQTREARPWCYPELMMSLCKDVWEDVCLCIQCIHHSLLLMGAGETGTLHNMAAHPACNHQPWCNLGNIIVVFTAIKIRGRQPF